MPWRSHLRSSTAAGALICGLFAVIAAGCGTSEPGASAAPKPAPAAATTAPVVTHAASAPPVAPPPSTATAQTATEEETEGSNPLPEDSALALPPMIHLDTGAADGGAAGTAAVKAVLRSKQLALSPAALRSVRAGKVSAGALNLLLRLPPPGSQLLVFAARGGRLQVQATSLAATRDLVTSLGDTTGGSLKLELRPVRPDFADIAQSKSAARQANIGARVVAIALTQVGIPYSWGGGGSRGPTTGTCNGYRGSVRPCPASRTIGYDCSGLTLFAYAQVGVTLDHYAAFQWLEGKRIDINALAPGDLVFFHPKADGPGHVGLYVGNGSFVHAPHTGDVVKVSPLSAYAGSYMGAVRPG
jgi:cell wall-associated NlpC family hydrolase